MGHAVHFLQRIERLSPTQADLALTLYREPALVRHLLQIVSLPEAAERVALALEDVPEGPHVIVTRDGRFVTCLGAGMTVGDCPVVSRLQLDRASERIERLRAAVDRGSETARLYERLLDSGSGLSREDFLALAALVPILGREYMNAALQMIKFLSGTLQRYRRPRYRKMTPLLREELRLYWTAEWALGHLAALCGERPDDVRAMCTLDKSDYEVFMRGLAELALCCMSPPILLRGAWTAARAGRALLPKLRQKMQASENRIEAMRFGVALVTLAMRHRRTFAETSKGLASQRRKLQEAYPLESNRGQIALLIRELQKVIEPEGQDKLRSDHIKIGAYEYATFAQRFPADSPMRFTRVEDVPEDLALTAAVNFDGNLYANHYDIARTLTAIPWLATASGADLYFPAKFFESCGPLFPLEVTRTRIDSYYHYYHFDRPARAEERPGRNEPCACGSGKKYKRCCGAAA